MVRLAANLSLMFTELPFLDRFAAAARAGFQAVEFMFPYSETYEAIAERLTNNNLTLALFNMPAGAWQDGERGLGALPDRVTEFREGAALALDYAIHLDCKRLHLMAGKTADLDQQACRKTLIDNIRFAADLAAQVGIHVLLEPINTRVDVPGYFYDSTAAAMEIIAEVNRPNVRLQYDIYHMQIMEGDLARTIERLLPSIGHVQLADNPGRHEPGTGEINFPWLLRRLDALGYAGFVGCEYLPAGDTQAGLGWAAPYLRA
jgi:hydroxypyruvate isomerase